MIFARARLPLELCRVLVKSLSQLRLACSSVADKFDATPQRDYRALNREERRCNYQPTWSFIDGAEMS